MLIAIVSILLIGGILALCYVYEVGVVTIFFLIIASLLILYLCTESGRKKFLKRCYRFGSDNNAWILPVWIAVLVSAIFSFDSIVRGGHADQPASSSIQSPIVPDSAMPIGLNRESRLAWYKYECSQIPNPELDNQEKKLQTLKAELRTKASVPAPLPKDLPKVLLKLHTDQIIEVTEWMKNLQYEHKLEISKWSAEELDKLLLLAPEARTSIISAITGQTIAEKILAIQNWFQQEGSELKPETKDILTCAEEKEGIRAQHARPLPKKQGRHWLVVLLLFFWNWRTLTLFLIACGVTFFVLRDERGRIWKTTRDRVFVRKGWSEDLPDRVSPAQAGDATPGTQTPPVNISRQNGKKMASRLAEFAGVMFSFEILEEVFKHILRTRRGGIL